MASLLLGECGSRVSLNVETFDSESHPRYAVYSIMRELYRA
jgi:hypothetical protein